MSVSLALGAALGFIAALLAHEVATHRVALALGDKTPTLYGRTGLSIRAHADVLGSYIIPAIFILMVLVRGGFDLPPFAWAKPHAITARNLKTAKRDAIIVSLTGPLVTGILAVVLGLIARSVDSLTIGGGAAAAAIVCGGLTVLELLPMPGRDGGRVLQQFLSPRAAFKMDELAEYAVLFVIGAYILLPGLFGSLFDAGCRALTGLPRCF